MPPVTRDQLRQVFSYLADRNRGQTGCWISVADVRGALGFDREVTDAACRRLGDDRLAEFMGGFPLRPTTGAFTLVRLTARGSELATDAGRAEEVLGSVDE
jgi:hypothetical protein